MMTNETRAELLESLAELGHAYPNWRLGQTMSNLAMAAERLDAGGVWDLEDDEALAAARHLLNRQTESSTGTAIPATGSVNESSEVPQPASL
jgi:hypothetical protein